MKNFQNLLGSLRFAIQESFIALIPYLTLSAILILAHSALLALAPEWRHLPRLETLSIFTRQLFPLLLALSVSYHVSFLFNTNRAIGSGLSILVFLVDAYGARAESEFYIAPSGMLTSLVAPIVAHTIFHHVQRFNRKLVDETLVGGNLAQILNLLAPFLVAFLFSLALLHAGRGFLADITQLVPLRIDDIPEFTGLSIFVIANQIIWFIGLHGNNVLNLVVSPGYLGGEVASGLSRINLINLFVGFGGSGAAISIALAVLIASRDRHMRIIAVAGLPFTFFNISEIIVYGLPVVFNLRLFWPFLLVPFANLAIAYPLVVLGGIGFIASEASWITPIGVNALIRGEGISALLLQGALLAMSTALYIPFVRRFGQSQNVPELRSLLGETLNIDERFRRQQAKNFQSMQGKILKAHWDARTAIDDLRQGELTLFYQPLICTQTHHCVGFEALMRFRRKDGTTSGPYFLSALEDAGFASIVDRWVCTRAAEDIASIAEVAPQIRVSLNLHPDTLTDRGFVDWLIEKLAGQRVTIEIIERGIRESSELVPNLQRLNEAGMSISIDDFGAGYSNLSGLTNFPVGTIKFDKKLLDNTATERGRMLYSTLAGLCRDLGYSVVAEGVEDAEQNRLMGEFGVNIVQGWHFAKAMPREDALAFALRQNRPEAALPA